MKKIVCCVYIIFSMFQVFQVSAIDTPSLEITPVRKEFSADPWATVGWTIKITNYTQNSMYLTVEPQNCKVANNNWTPHCQSISNTTINEDFAEWVTTNIQSFTIGSLQSQTVEYSISIPSDATPGGHYGAIFFNYTVQGDGSTTLWTVRSIGPIFLLTVSGEVIIDGEVTSVKSDGGGWAASDSDNTIGKNFIKSVFSSVTSVFGLSDILWNEDSETNEDTSSWETDTTEWQSNTSPESDTAPENISFSISFKNDGNTHIKPEGKVEIVDEDGNLLKWIGKKTEFNDQWVVIWEKIVDFLPINDQGWNVLPGNERDFDVTWNGFPYVTINEKWEQVVEYKNLSDYYTEQNLKGRNEVDLYFWEQLKSRIIKKKLTANITVIHKDKDGNDVPFNSAKDIFVEYKEQYVGINWVVVGIVWALWGMLLLSWGMLVSINARMRKIPSLEHNKIEKVPTKSAAKKTIIPWKKQWETYYDILKVKKSATQTEIKEAYEKILKDKKHTKEIDTAYKVLSQKKTRKEYDENLGNKKSK